MTNLPTLRLQLADAREALRLAKDAEATAKTIATMNVVGKNDDERKKATALALIESESYQDALTRLRDCEAEAERIEAAIDAARDERTAHELDIRERNNEVIDRLATAYERLARANPIHAAIDATLVR